jgi:hypothetical protein
MDVSVYPIEWLDVGTPVEHEKGGDVLDFYEKIRKIATKNLEN